MSSTMPAEWVRIADPEYIKRVKEVTKGFFSEDAFRHAQVIHELNLTQASRVLRQGFKQTVLNTVKLPPPVDFDKINHDVNDHLGYSPLEEDLSQALFTLMYTIRNIPVSPTEVLQAFSVCYDDYELGLIEWEKGMDTGDYKIAIPNTAFTQSGLAKLQR